MLCKLVDENGADITASNPLDIKVTGSYATGIVQTNGIDLRGASASKPAASAANLGYTYWSVDTDPSASAVEVSNGTAWVVM